VLCGNPGCDGKDPILSVLASCGTKTISYQNTSQHGVPTMRLCPFCGYSIYHKSGCKFIDRPGCPGCKKAFCFVCLSAKGTCSSFSEVCPKGVAPRQTSYPKI